MARAGWDREDSVLPAQRPATPVSTGDLRAVTAAAERGRRSVRADARHLMRSRLLYFAAGRSTLTVRISLLNCGARGTRTPDPCLQTGASTSTSVYRRSSPSCAVHPGPVSSGCIADFSAVLTGRFHARFLRAAWDQLLHAAVIAVAGCHVLRAGHLVDTPLYGPVRLLPWRADLTA